MIERGEIWFVDLEPTAGTEIRGGRAGERPVLVLSNGTHNRHFPVLAAPISRGGDSARTAGFSVPLTGLGLKTDGVALAHQIRAIDLRARGGRYVETAPDTLVDAVVDRLTLILGAND